MIKTKIKLEFDHSMVLIEGVDELGNSYFIISYKSPFDVGCMNQAYDILGVLSFLIHF